MTWEAAPQVKTFIPPQFRLPIVGRSTYPVEQLQSVPELFAFSSVPPAHSPTVHTTPPQVKDVPGSPSFSAVAIRFTVPTSLHDLPTGSLLPLMVIFVNVYTAVSSCALKEIQLSYCGLPGE